MKVNKNCGLFTKQGNISCKVHKKTKPTNKKTTKVYI